MYQQNSLVENEQNAFFLNLHLYLEAIRRLNLVNVALRELFLKISVKKQIQQYNVVDSFSKFMLCFQICFR